MFQDAQKNLIQNIKTSALWIFFHQKSLVVHSPYSIFIIFENLTQNITCKDSPFDSRKDPLSGRRITTGKKWVRTFLIKVIFLSNSVGFILRFCEVYRKPHPNSICGYFKNQLNHWNMTFKYRFIFNHRCVIDKFIFS